MNAIAILVVICFLVGVSRAWELIGGPEIGLAHEVTALVRGHGDADAPEDAAAVWPQWSRGLTRRRRPGL